MRFSKSRIVSSLFFKLRPSAFEQKGKPCASERREGYNNALDYNLRA